MLRPITSVNESPSNLSPSKLVSKIVRQIPTGYYKFEDTKNGIEDAVEVFRLILQNKADRWHVRARKWDTGVIKWNRKGNTYKDSKFRGTIYDEIRRLFEDGGEFQAQRLLDESSEDQPSSRFWKEGGKVFLELHYFSRADMGEWGIGKKVEETCKNPDNREVRSSRTYIGTLQDKRYFKIPLREFLENVLPALKDNPNYSEELFRMIQAKGSGTIPYTHMKNSFELTVSLPDYYRNYLSDLQYRDGYLIGPAFSDGGESGWENSENSGGVENSVAQTKDRVRQIGEPEGEIHLDPTQQSEKARQSEQVRQSDQLQEKRFGPIRIDTSVRIIRLEWDYHDALFSLRCCQDRMQGE